MASCNIRSPLHHLQQMLHHLLHNKNLFGAQFDETFVTLNSKKDIQKWQFGARIRQKKGIAMFILQKKR